MSKSHYSPNAIEKLQVLITSYEIYHSNALIEEYYFLDADEIKFIFNLRELSKKEAKIKAANVLLERGLLLHMPTIEIGPEFLSNDSDKAQKILDKIKNQFLAKIPTTYNANDLESS